EGAQFADPRRRPDAHAVLAEGAVGGDPHRRLHLRVVDDLQLLEREAGRVEEDLLRVGKTRAAENEHLLLAALRAARRDAVQDGRRCGGGATQQTHGDQRQQVTAHRGKSSLLDPGYRTTTFSREPLASAKIALAKGSRLNEGGHAINSLRTLPSRTISIGR